MRSAAATCSPNDRPSGCRRALSDPIACHRRFASGVVCEPVVLDRAIEWLNHARSTAVAAQTTWIVGQNEDSDARPQAGEPIDRRLEHRDIT
jgi:hypothetical protein